MPGETRKLRRAEIDFIRSLLRRSGNDSLSALLEECAVQEMDDGGMGSLLFLSGRDEKRLLGRLAAAAEFEDMDGILVSVNVNLDQFGDLFELDVWKVDFSPLLKFPRESDLRDTDFGAED
jgi:hypothetical protein